MEWIVIEKGGEQMRIRPRVLEKLLSEGWTVLGADPKETESAPVATSKSRTKSPKKEV